MQSNYARAAPRAHRCGALRHAGVGCARLRRLCAPHRSRCCRRARVAAARGARLRQLLPQLRQRVLVRLGLGGQRLRHLRRSAQEAAPDARAQARQGKRCGGFAACDAGTRLLRAAHLRVAHRGVARGGGVVRAAPRRRKLRSQPLVLLCEPGCFFAGGDGLTPGRLLRGCQLLPQLRGGRVRRRCARSSGAGARGRAWRRHGHERGRRVQSVCVLCHVARRRRGRGARAGRVSGAQRSARGCARPTRGIGPRTGACVGGRMPGGGCGSNGCVCACSAPRQRRCAAAATRTQRHAQPRGGSNTRGRACSPAAARSAGCAGIGLKGTSTRLPSEVCRSGPHAVSGVRPKRGLAASARGYSARAGGLTSRADGVGVASVQGVSNAAARLCARLRGRAAARHAA